MFKSVARHCISAKYCHCLLPSFFHNQHQSLFGQMWCPIQIAYCKRFVIQFILKSINRKMQLKAISVCHFSFIFLFTFISLIREFTGLKHLGACKSCRPSCKIHVFINFEIECRLF